MWHEGLIDCLALLWTVGKQKKKNAYVDIKMKSLYFF